MRLPVVLAALVAAGLLSGCGSSSTPSPPPPPPPPPPLGQLVVTWAPPRKNTDGTPITGFIGCRIYHDGLVETVPAMATSIVLKNLAHGSKHSLVVTSYNIYGEESARTCAGSGTVV